MQQISFMPKLSSTGKMPCESFSLPAQSCKTGAKLAQVAGSVCAGCYAMKGNYTFPAVKNARSHNLNLIESSLEQWASTMIVVISKTNASGFFRWHDSGDLQSMAHLQAIIAIAQALPNIRFWLPTKEKSYLAKINRAGVVVPENLTIRLSMPMIDQAPSTTVWANTSTVHKHGAVHGVECPAYKQAGKCLSCRQCWDKTILNISYPKH